MECSIYDQTLTRIGLLSGFISLVWRESYVDSGAIQLVFNKTAYIAGLIRPGLFVGIPSSDTLMLIQSTEDKEGQIWIYGCEAKILLDLRIYDGTIKCSGKIEPALRTAVMSKRPYSIIDLAPLRGLTKTTTSQRTYASLYGISQVLCNSAGYGFRLIHDKKLKKLLYDVYEGTERNGIKFSEIYGNLSNLTMLLSETNFRNVAYVGGAGEGADRQFVTVGATAASDFNRREIYVDARDIQQEEGQSAAEYRQLLEARGIEQLNECNSAIEVSFDISSKDFGTSFFLGDIITCVLQEYGMRISVRVAEFTKTYEGNTETTALTLGSPIIRGI